MKDYGRDADFLALADLSGDQLAHLYLPLLAEWKETLTLHLANPFCPYRQYQGAWKALSAAVSEAV